MTNDNMTNTQINYAYLTGTLEGILNNLPDQLAKEEVLKWNSKKYRKIQDIIEKEIARAIERERTFTNVNESLVGK